MEKLTETSISIASSNWNFYTFLKFFVPGMFTSFWIVLYSIRLVHSLNTADPILTDTQLLTFLHGNWSELIGIILALGSFIGIVFVGIDPIIRAFMGSRILNFVFKYLLSSKPVDFAYFQFMRMHDLTQRYERLPKFLVKRLSPYSSEFDALVEGDYSSRYLFRETIQNYFWQQCLDRDLRTDLSKRWELSSMFLYLSFSSLLLFVFQSFFYIEHLYSTSITSLSLFDLVPFVLVYYILASLCYNAYHGIMNERKEPPKKHKNRKFTMPKRKALILVSFVAYVAFCGVLHTRIQSLTWFDLLDIFLFSVFFMAFVSFYWSSTFEFSRYVINFEYLFVQHGKKIMSFAKDNLNLIKKMDKALSRKAKTKKKNAPLSDSSRICKNCSTKTLSTYSCPECSSVFCYPCAAYSGYKCSHCNVELRKAELML